MKYTISKILSVSFSLAFVLTLSFFGIANAQVYQYEAPVETFCRLVNGPIFETEGEQVRALQAVLREQLNPVLPRTGYYGPMTRSVVREFQGEYGIYPSGYVGPLTFRQMRTVWCAGSTTNPSGVPTVNAYTPTPNIQAGQTATIQISSSNVVSCTSNGGVYNGIVPTNGTIYVSPTINSVYTFICRSNNNQTVSANVNINVSGTTGNGLPVISISPANTNITAGQNTNISVNATNANTCQVSGGSFNNQQVAVTSTVTVSPTETTTYTVSCRNTYGVSNANFVVYVIANSAWPSVPVLTPAGGLFTSSTNVTVTSASSTSIRYTRDGSVPTCTTGNIYSGPILVSETQILKAIGCNSAGSSRVVSNTYDVVPNAAPKAVSASPAAGTYLSEKYVTLRSENSTSIRYTTYGTTPTCSAGSLYTEPIYVRATTTIKAIGCNNIGSSPVATLVYKMNLKAAGIPTATPDEGTYTGAKEIKLTSARSTSIRYTIDGTVPSCSAGKIYKDPITISNDTVVKVIGCNKSGNSAVTTFNYIID
jgi:peptidoglycan hydrolase-like protein with peptidoglycan-binding domain